MHTLKHLKSCFELPEVANLPQLRLSINSTRQELGDPPRFQVVHCKFCFEQFNQQFTGKLCPLCKRKVSQPANVNKQENKTKGGKGKVKVEKKQKKQKTVVSKEEVKKKKKKSKKDPTAGLCLSGKSGPDDARTVPMVHNPVSNKDKSFKKVAAKDKNKLKFLLNNKEEKKGGGSLKDFLKLM